MSEEAKLGRGKYCNEMGKDLIVGLWLRKVTNIMGNNKHIKDIRNRMGE